MKTLKLVRTKSDNKQTIGELWYEGKRIAYTLELPWRENQRRVSCIPKGVYEVIEHQAPSYPKAKSYWVQNVPNRSEILIHYGNFHRDTLGCILPGKELLDIDKDQSLDVTSSVATMKVLNKLLPPTFLLEISQKD